MNRFFSELQRRNVIKALVAYVGLSWLILQIVSVLVGLLGLSQLAGSATLLLLICGLPLAMYLSWHFDVSLKGITRTSSLDPEENSTIKPIGTWSVVRLLGVLVLCSIIGVQYYSSLKTSLLASQENNQAIEKTDSIAVLPFSDESPEKDQGFFATGLAEEITNLLGRSDLLKVSASRSSQVLAEKGLTPTEIGKRLGVQTILTGSISSKDNRVNVRVELQDTESGKILWTEIFVREFKNIFDLENEIGRAVVNLLQDKYVEAGDLANLSSTGDVDAYVLYLKGREEYRKQTTESMKEARALFEKAIAADPEYAKAYVALADSVASLSENAGFIGGFGELSTDIAADLAEQNLIKAITREPNLPEIYAVQGVVYMLRREYDNSLIAYDKALELNPNLAIAYMWKSIALTNLHQYEEAILAQRKSQDLDPLFLTSTFNLGELLRWQGRYDEAEALFNQLRIDFPESSFSYVGAAGLYFSQGDFVETIRQWTKAVELAPDNQEFTDKLLQSMSMLGLVEIIEGLTSDPFYDSTILIFKQKYDELFEKMAFDVAANPDDYWVAFEAGWYHSMFGNSNTAATLITDKAALISDADKFYMPHCSPAIEMAWAHRILGDFEKSEALLLECETLLSLQRQDSISYSEADYLAARIYALKGESMKAADALETAIQNGWREWWTSYDPILKILEDEPKLKHLITVIELDLAAQREEAQRLFSKTEQ